MLEMEGRSADTKLRLVEMRMAPAPEFVYASHSAVARSIQRGWLTDGTRPPCTDGIKVDEILVDGDSPASHSIPAGDHELRVRFSALRRDLELDLVLDLQVNDGTCIRAPAVNQSIPFVAKKRLAIIVATPIEGHGNLSGMNGYLAGTLGAGGWVGPTLISGALGFGGAMCNPATCAKGADGKVRHGLALPLSATVQYYPTFHRQDGILTAPFLGLRYAYVTGWLPATGGDKRVGVHGIHAFLGWSAGDGTPGPLRNMERNQLLELGIPVGIWIDPYAQGNHVAFGSGFELRLRLTP